MRWRTERLVEFFEDDRKQLSMSRLLCFLAFWPASYVVIANHSGDTLGWFLGAFVLGYIGSRGADVAAIRKTEGGKNAISDSGS